MERVVDIRLEPSKILDEEEIKKAVVRQTNINYEDIGHVEIIKRSIDARGSNPVYNLKIIINSETEGTSSKSEYRNVEQGHKIYIIGAGPAGYFAALKLLKLGFCPVIFEKGKDVQKRRRDLRGLQQFGVVHPRSNYCFGEGGAGTYSDGKLYTRSNKRGNVKSILRTLIDHGASEDIQIDAHPHIGSNKLPQVVANIRQTIVSHGGKIHFDSSLTNLIIKKGELKGFIINDDEEIRTESLILATGHSARDVYNMLKTLELSMDLKPFAVGVRIEHPQALINSIQYGLGEEQKLLPAASYRLACQVDDKGVYSFCMCPGGLIVPASTAPGELVVNGMSLSRRDSPFANAGTVVEINAQDIGSNKAWDGLQFQSALEQMVFSHGDGSQRAPAQRLTDFVLGKVSSTLPPSSYIPGLYSLNMAKILPEKISEALRQGIKTFGKKMRGYFTEEAQVVGLESRTSSPIRIPRDEGYMHPQCLGLYPCGEGAGYAGGIVSAAIDGENVALKVAERMSKYKLK